MVFLVSQFLFVLFGLFGLMTWACSDMPLAMREIAINTRRSAEHGSSYALMRVLSVCLKILAVLLWVAGIAMIVFVAVTGSAIPDVFSGLPF
jgi:type III secretory pathway component EscU